MTWTVMPRSSSMRAASATTAAISAAWAPLSLQGACPLKFGHSQLSGAPSEASTMNLGPSTSSAAKASAVGASDSRVGVSRMRSLQAKPSSMASRLSKSRSTFTSVGHSAYLLGSFEYVVRPNRTELPSSVTTPSVGLKSTVRTTFQRQNSASSLLNGPPGTAPSHSEGSYSPASIASWTRAAYPDSPVIDSERSMSRTTFGMTGVGVTSTSMQAPPPMPPRPPEPGGGLKP